MNMKRLIAVATMCGCLTLTVQAGKIILPLTLTARATDTVTTNLLGLTGGVTNWVSLHGITVAASNGCSATVSIFTRGGNATNLYSETVITAPSTGYRLHMLMPRKGVWPDANHAVERYPLTGTNCFLSVKQTAGVATNAYFIQVIVE